MATPLLTPENQALFEKARWDFDAFCRLIGIQPHRGQRRMFNAYLRRDASGWRAMYLWLMVSSGNRAGKTLAVAIIILHACIYKDGMAPPPEWNERALQRWSTRPYAWYHFAVQQEVADIVWTQIMQIFTGIHPAQKDGVCPLADMVGGAKHIAAWDVKYKGDYRWIKFTPFFGGADVHFRSTSEAAIGSLGQDVHGISFDEVGFQTTKFEFVINEVLHTRRMGTGGQMVLISTPSEGINEWSDLWYTGDPDSPDHKPGRFAMRMSTRDNVGYGLDAETFDRMIEDMDERQIAQNVDGYFLQGSTMYFSAESVEDCFVDGLPERMEAKLKHLYLQGIDPSLTQDASWSLTFDALILPKDRETGDITLVGVDARTQQGQQTIETLTNLAISAHHTYTQNGARCMTAIDATGFGGKLFKQLIQDAIPEVYSVEFGGSVAKKRRLLGNLRTMIDGGRLLMPRMGPWQRVRRQLLGYKVLDKKIEQDAVMALAIMVDLVKRASPDGEVSTPFIW